MKKRRLFAAVIASAVLGLVGCGSSENSDEGMNSEKSTETAVKETVIELSLADAQPAGCAANYALTAMVEEINKESEGSIHVTYYPNSQLGNERDLAEGVLAGTVDMVYVSCAVMQNFEDSFALFSLPFVFKDYDHVHAFRDSELGAQIFENLESSNRVKVLGLMDQGFRWIWTADKEVKTLEDLSGLKLRTPESDVYTKTFELLGSNPTPMAFGDLFTALQTGVVQGYEVNPESTWSNGTYEAIDYGVKSNHIYAGSVVFMSQAVYDRMSEEQKEIVMTAADNAVVLNNKIALESEEDYEQKLTEAGLVINSLSEDERDKFAEMVQPLYENYYDLIGGKSFVDHVRTMEY